jgi:hypothetical protein
MSAAVLLLFIASMFERFAYYAFLGPLRMKVLHIYMVTVNTTESLSNEPCAESTQGLIKTGFLLRVRIKWGTEKHEVNRTIHFFAMIRRRCHHRSSFESDSSRPYLLAMHANLAGVMFPTTIISALVFRKYDRTEQEMHVGLRK